MPVLGVECPSEEVYGEGEMAVLAKVVQKMLSQGTYKSPICANLRIVELVIFFAGHVFESPETIQQNFVSNSTEM